MSLFLFCVVWLLCLVSVAARSQFCKNPNRFVKEWTPFQRDQWAKARQEITDLGCTHMDLNRALKFNMAFFQKVFYVDAIRIENSTKAEYIAYYSIWKAGNTEIRQFLHEYSKESGVVTSANRNGVRIGIGPRATSGMLLRSGRFVYSEAKGFYTFTFGREPISRLISGYTEIEVRSKAQLKQPRPWVPKKSCRNSLDAVDRFENFVEYLLYYSTSALSIPHLMHIAPMVGTLSLASSLQSNIHIFHLEDFDNVWMHICTELNQPGLCNAVEKHHSRVVPVHGSSKDPLNTTNAAKSFFKRTKRQQFQQQQQQLLQHRQLEEDVRSRAYQRALCRMYIIDYHCFEYEFPAICADIQQELLEYQLNGVHLFTHE